MNETNIPKNNEPKILRGEEDTFLIPTANGEAPKAGIPVPDIAEGSSEIQHDEGRVAFSDDEIAANSLLSKTAGLNHEIHAEVPEHIPVLADDDTTEEIPVHTGPQDTSVANPRRVSFLRPDSRQIPKKYQ